MDARAHSSTKTEYKMITLSVFTIGRSKHRFLISKVSLRYKFVGIRVDIRIGMDGVYYRINHGSFWEKITMRLN